MSTEQKETQLHKILRDLSNERPVTVMSLKASLVLETWDGEKLPENIKMMIEDLFNL